VLDKDIECAESLHGVVHRQVGTHLVSGGCVKVLTCLFHRAVSASGVVEIVGKALMVESTAVQMVTESDSQCLRDQKLMGQIATECLHTLFLKPFFEDDDFQSLVCPMYYSQTVELLKNIFTWIRVDPNDIDEERYLFLKKFSEVEKFHVTPLPFADKADETISQMIANLGSFIEDRATALPNGIDLPNFLALTFLISSHDSLAISIPTLNLWTKILRSDILSQLDAVLPFTAQLLELATTRLIKVCLPISLVCSR
jgi:exportin-5